MRYRAVCSEHHATAGASSAERRPNIQPDAAECCPLCDMRYIAAVSALPRLHLGCLSSAAPRLHLGCTSAAPRLHLGCTSAAPRLYLGCTSAAPRPGGLLVGGVRDSSKKRQHPERTPGALLLQRPLTLLGARNAVLTARGGGSVVVVDLPGGGAAGGHPPPTLSIVGVGVVQRATEQPGGERRGDMGRWRSGEIWGDLGRSGSAFRV